MESWACVQPASVFSLVSFWAGVRSLQDDIVKHCKTILEMTESLSYEEQWLQEQHPCPEIWYIVF